MVWKYTHRALQACKSSFQQCDAETLRRRGPADRPNKEVESQDVDHRHPEDP